MGITVRLNEDIKKKKIAEIAETERKMSSMNVDEIVNYISDPKKTVTKDYIIRRYIVENLAEIILPPNFMSERDNFGKLDEDAEDKEWEKEDTGKEWDENVVKIAAQNLKKLQKERGVDGDIKWESYLVPSNIRYKAKSVLKIAFTLGMDIYETGRLMCAWDCNYFEIHDPLCLSAYFCMSDEALNKYEIFKKISSKVCEIFDSVQDYESTNNKKHFFDNIPDESATAIMFRHFYKDELSTMNEDERIEAFIEDVKNNAKDLKMYSTSNSSRKILKMLIDDLKKIYIEHDFNIRDIGTNEKERAGVDADTEFFGLMKTIRRTYLDKYKNVSKKIHTDLPDSVENTINNLQSDITNVAHGAIRLTDKEKERRKEEAIAAGKEYNEDKEHKVTRRSVIMLVYLMLQRYIEQLIEFISVNDAKNYMDDRLDCKFLEPITLYKDFTLQGDRDFHERAYDIADAIIMNENESDDEIIEDKMNLFIDVVNHFMNEMNLFPFYIPNEIDRFFLLIFMTNDPIGILEQIITKYSLD